MSQESKQFKKFIHLFSGLSFSIILILGLFNFIIDPITVHQTPLIKYVNIVKAHLGNYDRWYRALEIARQKPEAIILGSSRTAAGINPDDLQALTGVKGYNSGLSGATFEEMYHYFEHALYHQPKLKVAVIGVDFFAFNKFIKPREGFCAERLKKSFYLNDWLNSLISLQILSTSYDTFKKNYSSGEDYRFYSMYLPNGSTNPLVPANNLTNPVLQKGHLWYLKTLFYSDYKSYVIDPKRIEMFRQLVKTCRDKGIELKVFIPPAKAVYWEFIYGLGYWNIFEDLKRELSAIHPIWDFSGFNCVTMETLENHEQPLYYECSHFTPYTGSFILKKLFNQPSLPDFGYLLTPETVENHLKQIREKAIPWIETHDITTDLKNFK